MPSGAVGGPCSSVRSLPSVPLTDVSDVVGRPRLRSALSSRLPSGVSAWWGSPSARRSSICCGLRVTGKCVGEHPGDCRALASLGALVAGSSAWGVGLPSIGGGSGSPPQCRPRSWKGPGPRRTRRAWSRRGDRIRTCSRRCWRPLLFQLSYTPSNRDCCRRRGVLRAGKATMTDSVLGCFMAPMRGSV